MKMDKVADSVLPVIIVTKNDGTKRVCAIMQHKLTKKYSFVNITKGHICSCEFNTQEEALKDLRNKYFNKEIATYILYEDVPIAEIIQHRVKEKENNND